MGDVFGGITGFGPLQIVIILGVVVGYFVVRSRKRKW